MNEFIINEYITLKLEDGKTNIYIKGELFRQCKYLLLFIPTEDISSAETIDSIDEASEKLNFSLDPDTVYINPELREIIAGIDHETEFWAHCSNLQVWAEYNYDTRLLHSNLAFPLLKKLTDVGDLVAKKVFKEEIGRRYFNGVKTVQIYLQREGYLQYLSKDEIRSFINNDSDVIEELETILEIDLNITVLPEYFANVLIQNREIIGLRLSNLNLKRLSDCIRRVKHLEILDLVGNELEEIPDWIGELKALKMLNAVNNNIKKIPNSIGKLKSLVILKLSQNKIKELPESIGDLISLKELFLNSNRLKNLPESIEKLKSLKVIFAAKNSLISLPESIGNLDSLQSLNIGDNPIRDLPTSICKLPSLEELLISETNIEKENKILEDLKKKKVEIYVY